MSAFALEDQIVCRTYWVYGRGLDILWGAYARFDRAPLGYDENGSLPFRRHDEYAQTPNGTART